MSNLATPEQPQCEERLSAPRSDLAATLRPVRRNGTLRRAPARSVEKLVIIGNGMIGFKLCEKLVETGGHQAFEIVVFGEEPRPAYDRVNLTALFSGRTADQLLLASREWYAEHQIQLRLKDPAVTVDRERRLVRSASGHELRYDRLVFATGSRPFVPPIAGRDLPGVFVYRTVEDLEAIRHYSRRCRRAATLGGGLLGLEAAEALVQLGLETHVIEREAGLLPRQLDPAGAALLKLKIEQLGVQVHVQTETQRIAASGDQRRLLFANGDSLNVDMVVISTGIRPRDELAAACGLVLGPKGGILINDALETSDPRIHAIGECAVHNGIIYGLVVPGYRMAEVLVANLLGGRQQFPGADFSARLKLMGVDVATVGDYQADGEVVCRQRDGDYRQLVLRHRKLVGAVSVGPWPELARVREAIDRQRRLWPWQVRRFVRTGSPWLPSAARDVSQWPATATVCLCMNVKRAALSRALAEGCHTVEALAKCTGAATVCGSCKPLLAELAGAPAAAPAKSWRGLLVVSALALVLVLGIALLQPIPYSDTVQGGSKLDTLWLDKFWKQVTGGTLLGLSVLALLLSLRKRIPRLAVGNFGWWRLLHGVIGVALLLALICHTGFRLGHNLSFLLMINFLALGLSGALAGGVIALETRLNPATARRLRQFFIGAHFVLFWPLPVLILFHLLKVYYF